MTRGINQNMSHVKKEKFNLLVLEISKKIFVSAASVC